MSENTEKKILLSVQVLDNFIAAKKNVDFWSQSLKEAQESGSATKAQLREIAENLAKANNGFKDAKKEIESAARSQEMFAKASDKAVKSMGQMKTELAALRSLSLDNLKPEQIREVELRMAELTDELSDYKTKIKGLDTAKTFANIAEGAQVAVASVQVFSQGLSALGVENESLKKLQDSTMEMIGAVQSLGVVSEYLADKKYKLIAANIATLISNTKETISTKLNTLAKNQQAVSEDASTFAKIKGAVATKLITAAQWLWNAALSANPIGAIVAGIVVLVAGVALLMRALDNSEKKFEKVNASIKATNKTLSDFGEQTKINEERLKAEGKTDLEIWNYKKQRYAEELALNRKRYSDLKNAGRDLSDDEKQQLADSAKFISQSAKTKYQIETEGINIKKKLSSEALELEKKNLEKSVTANKAAAAQKKKDDDKAIEDRKKAEELYVTKRKQLSSS